jgi:hypothetical protein
MTGLAKRSLACLAVGLTALGAGSWTPGAAGHGTTPDGRGEAQLRALETATLGAEHAHEHAMGRQLARQRPSRPDVAPLPSSAGSETVFGQRLAADGPASALVPVCDEASTGPECAGSWTAPFAIPVMAINAVMLPTGKVLWWAYPTNPNPVFGNPDAAENTAQAWLWDPATGKRKRVDPPLWQDPADGQLKPANIWCSGQSLLQDGRVVVAGGNLAYEDPDAGVDFAGLDAVFTFNPWNERWTRQEDMENGRWYPSQVLLPDGRTLILSGYDETGSGDINTDVEILEPSSNLDGVGDVTKIGELGSPGPPEGGTYPHTFVMPSGRVMVAGPNPNDSWLLHDPGPDNSVFEWDNFAWDELGAQTPGVSRQRLYGTGVLLPPPPGSTDPSTKVALIGGDDRTDSNDDPAVATVRIHDENDDPALGGTLGAPLNLGRGHHNTVLLPDGSMVTVGGGLGFGDDFGLWESTPGRRRVELYDPLADEWRLGAAQAEYRAYHSTAILLPDGRVVSAGDDYNGGIDKDTAEIYSPPYLFRGPRPTITGAPKTVSYGTSFDVSHQGPAVTRAALVAPGAATHAVDMNQRWVPLDVTPGAAGTVTVEAPPGDTDDPPGRNVAPPGWYMLFLLSDDGVPSVASWVRVGATPPAPGTVTVRNVVSPAAAGSFDYSGAPFVDFTLGNGQERSKTVVASTYTVTQAAEPGFALTAVECDDGNSTGSTAGRSAIVRVEAGEAVRCTFTSAAVAGPPKPPVEPPPAGKPDTRKPVVTFSLERGLDLRRKLLRGSARDTSGIRRVDVALGAQRSARCRWWSRRLRRLGAIRSCRRPAFIRAKLTRSGGGVRWSATLGTRPPAGRYRVVIRAVDRRGNVKQVTRKPLVVSAPAKPAA